MVGILWSAPLSAVRLQSFEECVEMVSIRVRGYFVARASWSTSRSAIMLPSSGV